jgi:hypothetical protein
LLLAGAFFENPERSFLPEVPSDAREPYRDQAASRRLHVLPQKAAIVSREFRE